MRRILILLVLLSSFIYVYSQDEIVTVPFNGVVTDLFGNPLKRVKVYTYSKKVHTYSDKKGRFGLTNVQPTDTLHFIYNKVKYDVPVDGRKSMRVCLAEEIKSSEDEELVNIGMAYVKRREYSGSSSGISGETLVRTGKTNILDALQGLVPGFTYYNGNPLIRGASSINSSTTPLYILDGAPVYSLDYINVHDVERVDVIKGPNMYGVRGANGVIVVTTKSASKR